MRPLHLVNPFRDHPSNFFLSVIIILGRYLLYIGCTLGLSFLVSVIVSLHFMLFSVLFRPMVPTSSFIYSWIFHFHFSFPDPTFPFCGMEYPHLRVVSSWHSFSLFVYQYSPASYRIVYTPSCGYGYVYHLSSYSGGTILKYVSKGMCAQIVRWSRRRKVPPKIEASGKRKDLVGKPEK